MHTSLVLVGIIKRAFRVTSRWLLYILAVPAVFLMRAVRPWILIRIDRIWSSRIGHFAANTELYLCEKDAGINVPVGRYIDLFYFAGPICNQQLATMWKRTLRIWPRCILYSIMQVNQAIPKGKVHVIGDNTDGRDIHDLLDRFASHLKFTADEENRGQAGLRNIGIPPHAPFVCLIVRDSAYLDAYQPYDWSYHNYRDGNIQNYVLASEELADQGYFVIRMGVKVKEALKTNHPRVIDYATNGMRNDFMDIYLGAYCKFCISTSTGWDEIPQMFRRPIAYINVVPFGRAPTFRKESIFLTKHHIQIQGNKKLTLSEIFTQGVGFCARTSDFESKGIQLVENTPEEIRDAVIEMALRLKGTWQPHEDDEILQKRFWELFPIHAKASDAKSLHGEIRGRFGAAFLRNNQDWLQ